MVSRGAKRNGRGGNQPPASPAPVSGPGALSQRTDGGAAQPIRPAANDGGYGDRQAAVAQQQSAPMRAGGVATPAVQPGAMQDPAAAGGIPTGIDPFGPTQRPYEPVTAGARLGAGASPPSEASTNYDLLVGILQAHPEAAGSLAALLEDLDPQR